MHSGKTSLRPTCHQDFESVYYYSASPPRFLGQGRASRAPPAACIAPVLSRRLSCCQAVAGARKNKHGQWSPRRPLPPCTQQDFIYCIFKDSQHLSGESSFTAAPLMQGRPALLAFSFAFPGDFYHSRPAHGGAAICNRKRCLHGTLFLNVPFGAKRSDACAVRGNPQQRKWKQPGRGSCKWRRENNGLVSGSGGSNGRQSEVDPRGLIQQCSAVISN